MMFRILLPLSVLHILQILYTPYASAFSRCFCRASFVITPLTPTTHEYSQSRESLRILLPISLLESKKQSAYVHLMICKQQSALHPIISFHRYLSSRPPTVLHWMNVHHHERQTSRSSQLTSINRSAYPPIIKSICYQFFVQANQHQRYM